MMVTTPWGCIWYSDCHFSLVPLGDLFICSVGAGTAFSDAVPIKQLGIGIPTGRLSVPGTATMLTFFAVGLGVIVERSNGQRIVDNAVVFRVHYSH